MTQLNQLSAAKQKIMMHLKHRGPATIGRLSRDLSYSLEAIRRHLSELKSDGWVAAENQKTKPQKGRPATFFHITHRGEHLFPKLYDQMFVALLDTVLAVVDPDQALRILHQFTEKRMAPFEGNLEGMTLRQKLEVLKNLYWQGDPHVEIERDAHGYRLVEYNCPLLTVALKRPVVCSTSVNLISRLLGVKVVREERFQTGHGRCVFRILAEEKQTERDFQLEPDP